MRSAHGRFLVPGLEATAYVHHPLHCLLATDLDPIRGDNVGTLGHNLTICFVSLERRASSIRLLRSIRRAMPGFAGEIVAVDNGSSPATVAALRETARELALPFELVELDRNYGVCFARNRAVERARTEWLLLLDNDQYFVDNPLTEIQNAIALLGAHFVNLPLLQPDERSLFALGGHLYVDVLEGSASLGVGSALRQGMRPHAPLEPFLSTFLFGGGAVHRRQSYLELGGFDEEFQVGFVDVELSLRILRAGMKIGNAITYSLVHAHEPPATAADKEYERLRYSTRTIERSARIIERKYDVSVRGNALSNWLKRRRVELGVAEPGDESAGNGTATEIPAADTPTEEPARTSEPTALDGMLIPGLRVTAYVHHPLQRLLSDGIDAERGDNIGTRGHNLTISFLSLERPQLSIRLMRSIRSMLPGFEGRVLAVDNGSSQATVDALRRAADQLEMPFDLVEMDRNHGVSGGRNLAVAHLQTDWVMFLDNDIYFIDDPIPAIQHAIALLGVKFLNVPLLEPNGKNLFLLGGHIYVDLHDGHAHLGAGSVLRQGPVPEVPLTPFLSTFLSGGAAVVNVKAFRAVGGFDEELLVGFEDVDFSLRLFRAGVKVGNAIVYALVHAHEAPRSDADREYERRRFSSTVIERSARHLERKYGFTLWNDGLQSWLDRRHVELGLGATDEQAGAVVPGTTRAEVVSNPRIVLVTDTDGWAFANIATQVSRQLGHRYDFRIIPFDLVGNLLQLLVMTEKTDLLHIFWRDTADLFDSEHERAYLQQSGVDPVRFDQRFRRNRKLSTCVYDHLHLDPEGIERKRDLFCRKVTGYYVSTARLKGIYDRIAGYPAPLAALPDGVDLDLFRPIRLDRFENDTDRPLVVGWSGNSKWSGGGTDLDIKGVRTILRPAIELLRREGLAVEPRFADRAETFTPHAQMVDYYAGIDVYVCTSLHEGTPNPVLEAMACGVPVISTDVGLVPDVFGPRQMELLVRERSVERVADALRRLYRDRSLLSRLSQENLESVRGWTWRDRARAFAPYFDRLLGQE